MKSRDQIVTLVTAKCGKYFKINTVNVVKRLVHIIIMCTNVKHIITQMGIRAMSSCSFHLCI